MPSSTDAAQAPEHSLLGLILILAHRWRLIALGALGAGALALAVSYLIRPTFTSRTVFLPPQAPQSAAASALAQLGALSGLAGAATGAKSPADQYVALLQSVTVADRLIDQFKLLNAYGVEYRFEARKRLAENSRISLGKRDGLITVEVDDHDSQRAADIANQYVHELRQLAAQIALTEAQQRRAFFESRLKTSRDQLTKAQQALQGSGFNLSALRADARAAAESYAKLRAEAAATEVKLDALRRNLADTTPEVQQALSVLGALRAQLSRQEVGADADGGADYVSRFREFKYQEALFDLFARQFELARLDESREGGLIQVIDPAFAAEWKSRPKRALMAIASALGAALALAGWVLARDALLRANRGGGTPAAPGT